MFKVGDKVKYIGIGGNHYGDTHRGEDEGHLIKGKIYTIKYTEPTKIEKLQIIGLDIGEDRIRIWNLYSDCVEKIFKNHRKLPDWW